MGKDTTAVLIVAGGSGTRMGGPLPKQFIDLCGKPVIVHTVERFCDALPEARIYIALGEGMEQLWERVAVQYELLRECRVCRGGRTRFETVRNSLAAISPCDIVLVHDAVRPLVPLEVIRDVVRVAREHGAAIPVVTPTDSFRIVMDGERSEPLDRARLRAVQTPQGFRYDLLKQAYGQPYRDTFTDDAQVVEALGHRVVLCDGSPENIKITYPADIAVASAVLVQAAPE